MPQNPPEQPIYVQPQKKIRTILPKSILLIILSIILYSGVLINLSLLELNAEQQLVVNYASMLLVAMILILGIFLEYHLSKQPYQFYQDRIIVHHKPIFYSNLTTIQKKQDFLDKIFKTYSLKLNNLEIKNLPIETDLENYFNQLINFSKQREFSQNN